MNFKFSCWDFIDSPPEDIHDEDGFDDGFVASDDDDHWEEDGSDGDDVLDGDYDEDDDNDNTNGVG